MKDKYIITGITEKSKVEYQVAFSVESDDVPFFTGLATGRIDEAPDAVMARVADVAYEQLSFRREELAKETARRTEEENRQIQWDNLKQEIESRKAKEMPLKKPTQKRKRLEAPNGDDTDKEEE